MENSLWNRWGLQHPAAGVYPLSALVRNPDFREKNSFSRIESRSRAGHYAQMCIYRHRFAWTCAAGDCRSEADRFAGRSGFPALQLCRNGVFDGHLNGLVLSLLDQFGQPDVAWVNVIAPFQMSDRLVKALLFHQQ